MSAVMESHPNVDLAEAGRFLTLMAEGEAVTFQTIDDDADRKARELARVLPAGHLDTHAERLKRFNARGAGVFWTVNFTDGTGRKAENITAVRAVFLDLDGPPLQPVLAAGVEPHAVVESSPGKWHCYWLVSGCTLDQFMAAQLALAAKFGGDPSVNDLSRVMRLPGFIHRKGEPFRSRIVSMEQHMQPYQFDDLVQRLGLDLSAPPPPQVDPETGEISGKVQTGGRHTHLVKRAGQMNWGSFPAAAVRAGLHEINAADCEPPLPQAEVDAIAVDIVRRYAAQHGRDLEQQRQAAAIAAGMRSGAVDDDHHRNAPKPDPACLYGLVGDIARAGAETTEANPFAVALNALAYIGCGVGRGPFLPVGNTYHHARIFGLHVGRSAIGRKGEAVSLLHRIDMSLRQSDEVLCPQVHRGGLSSREGLICLIHDGFMEGKNEVPAIQDKRLWVLESEFANILHQTKRDGNTLSAALRDCWDGATMKPATKTNRISASNPHISLSAAVTPSELLSLIEARELSNGFANRFITIYSERYRLLPFASATHQSDVDALAARVADVLRFAGADRWVDRDHLRMSFDPAARKLYERLYRGELNRHDFGPLVTGLLQRRAPVLLRLAMIFALTDQTEIIGQAHIEAALAWIRFWVDSVRFVFNSGAQELAQQEITTAAGKIVEFLANGRKSRWEISAGCFHGKLSKDRLDAALDELLHATPPTVLVQVEERKSGPGSPTKFYSLSAKSAKSAKCEDWRGFPADFQPGEVSEVSEVRSDAEDTADPHFARLRSLRQTENGPETRAVVDTSLTSLTSPANADEEDY